MKTQIVTLNADRKTLNNTFKAGEQFKVLSRSGTLIRLSRVGDNAKLMTDAECVGLGETPEPKPYTPKPENTTTSAPHSDESGDSKPVLICSTLAGKNSGDTYLHFTPKENKEYCEGMAKLAEMYPG